MTTKSDVHKYKGYVLFAIEFMGDWILHIAMSPTQMIESQEIFTSEADAIAYGKEQIDKLFDNYAIKE
jgi:hypothetical protein